MRDGGDGVLYNVWLVRLSSLSSPASRMGRKITGGMVLSSTLGAPDLSYIRQIK